MDQRVKATHRMHMEVYGGKTRAWCTTCGIEDTPAAILRHTKDSRRWNYDGIEWVNYEAYHMWTHKLTGLKYAWLVVTYTAAATKMREGKGNDLDTAASCRS